MPHYRLYFMNSRNGHIDRVENLQARDDREAIETAQPLAGLQPVELWEGPRKVHRFDATQDAFLERRQPHRAPRQHQVTSVHAEAAE